MVTDIAHVPGTQETGLFYAVRLFPDVVCLPSPRHFDPSNHSCENQLDTGGYILSGISIPSKSIPVFTTFPTVDDNINLKFLISPSGSERME